MRSVTAAVARFDLQRGPGGRLRPLPAVLNSKRQLGRLYAEHGSTTRIARQLRCPQTAARDAMDRLGTPRRQTIKYTDRAWFADANRVVLTMRTKA